MKELLHSVRELWLTQGRPDTLALLQANPELGKDSAAVLELAYEEFCQRRDAGEVLDYRVYCEQFPGCRSALREMLSVDRAIGENPELLDGPAVSDNWPQIGEVVSDCHLLRQLGFGAFSRVYLAHESTTDRYVVLKVSNLPTGEARFLGPIVHDHIVPVHWARKDEWGRHLVCMPFLGSATLVHVLDRLYPRRESKPPRHGNAIVKAIASTVRRDDPPPARPVPGLSPRGPSFVSGVRRLGQSLASTLAYLHKNGRAHCDLKPPNILLAPEGQPLLLDFNLSRGPTDPGDRTGGTFPYMAPEQLISYIHRKPLSQEQAAASDVFALGVLLYELLCGQHPFGAPPRQEKPVESAAVMQQMQMRRVVPLRHLNPDVPASLASLIGRCLALDASARPTAAHVAEALRDRPRLWIPAAAACMLALGLAFSTYAMSVPDGVHAPNLVSPPDTHQERERGLSELKAARAHFARNETKQAEERLRSADAALESVIDDQVQQGSAPVVWTDYFERGRVRLLLGDRAAAHNYFDQADKAYRKDFFPVALTVARLGTASGPGLVAVPALGAAGNRDGRTLAYLAYSHALAANHKESLGIGTEAVESGFATAVVFNNLGYSRMVSKANLKDAAAWLDRAIELDPTLAAAYHNRARLAMQMCRGEMPDQARLDIDQAITLVEKSELAKPAGLYRLGVLINVKAYQQAKQAEKADHALYLHRAARYLERACVLGLDPGPLLALDPNLADFLKQSGLDAIKLAELRKQDQVPAVWTYLVEPTE